MRKKTSRGFSEAERQVAFDMFRKAEAHSTERAFLKEAEISVGVYYKAKSVFYTEYLEDALKKIKEKLSLTRNTAEKKEENMQSKIDTLHKQKKQLKKEAKDLLFAKERKILQLKRKIKKAERLSIGNMLASSLELYKTAGNIMSAMPLEKS